MLVLLFLATGDVLPDRNYHPVVGTTRKCDCGDTYYIAAPDANLNSRVRHMESKRHTEYLETLNSMCKLSVASSVPDNIKKS